MRLSTNRLTAGLLLVATLLLAACGGGGGGEPDKPSVQLSTSSVAFNTIAGSGSGVVRDLQISWSGSGIAEIGYGLAPGHTSQPGWLSIEVLTRTNPATVRLRCSPLLTAGIASVVYRVYALDSSGNPLATADLTVTHESIAAPSFVPGSAAMSWVESEQPTPVTLPVQADARMQLASAQVDVSWLSVAVGAGGLTISGTADSRTRPPGSHHAVVTARFSYEGITRDVSVPVTATVGPALAGPAAITLEVNASTTPAQLASVATLVSRASSPVTFTVSSDVPWLTASGGVTGSAGNLGLALQATAIAALPDGEVQGRLTVTPQAANMSVLVIPVTLRVRLPAVHRVTPVAFTHTAATDYVVVRGVGFSDPGAKLRVDGTPATAATVMSDTEIRLVPGAVAVGDHGVDVPNALGLERRTATLRVADPPSWAATSMTYASIGDQSRVFASPINGAVFSVKCWYCSINQGGTASTLQRFAYDASSGTWTRTVHGYPQLMDALPSLDESSLYVLTETNLLRVDPRSMATLETIPVPFKVSGSYEQLALTNDGLVIVHALHKAWSLEKRAWVDLNWLLVSNAGIQASRDGSRAMFGFATNDGSVPYRYYDASTGQVVTTPTFQHYAWGKYTRHAERALVNSYLLDADLNMLFTLSVGGWSGDVSPDGRRVYGTASGSLHTYDVSGSPPYPEVGSGVPLGDVGIDRVAVDPSGSFVYVVGETKFHVIDVR